MLSVQTFPPRLKEVLRTPRVNSQSTGEEKEYAMYYSRAQNLESEADRRNNSACRSPSVEEPLATQALELPLQNNEVVTADQRGAHEMERGEQEKNNPNHEFTALRDGGANVLSSTTGSVSPEALALFEELKNRFKENSMSALAASAACTSQDTLRPLVMKAMASNVLRDLESTAKVCFTLFKELNQDDPSSLQPSHLGMEQPTTLGEHLILRQFLSGGQSDAIFFNKGERDSVSLQNAGRACVQRIIALVKGYVCRFEKHEGKPGDESFEAELSEMQKAFDDGTMRYPVSNPVSSDTHVLGTSSSGSLSTTFSAVSESEGNARVTLKSTDQSLKGQKTILDCSVLQLNSAEGIKSVALEREGSPKVPLLDLSNMPKSVNLTTGTQETHNESAPNVIEEDTQDKEINQSEQFSSNEGISQTNKDKHFSDTKPENSFLKPPHSKNVFTYVSPGSTPDGEGVSYSTNDDGTLQVAVGSAQPVSLVNPEKDRHTKGYYDVTEGHVRYVQVPYANTAITSTTTDTPSDMPAYPMQYEQYAAYINGIQSGQLFYGTKTGVKSSQEQGYQQCVGIPENYAYNHSTLGLQEYTRLSPPFTAEMQRFPNRDGSQNEPVTVLPSQTSYAMPATYPSNGGTRFHSAATSSHAGATSQIISYTSEGLTVPEGCLMPPSVYPQNLGITPDGMCRQVPVGMDAGMPPSYPPGHFSRPVGNEAASLSMITYGSQPLPVAPKVWAQVPGASQHPVYSTSGYGEEGMVPSMGLMRQQAPLSRTVSFMPSTMMTNNISGSNNSKTSLYPPSASYTSFPPVKPTIVRRAPSTSIPMINEFGQGVSLQPQGECMKRVPSFPASAPPESTGMPKEESSIPTVPTTLPATQPFSTVPLPSNERATAVNAGARWREFVGSEGATPMTMQLKRRSGARAQKTESTITTANSAWRGAFGGLKKTFGLC